MKPSRKAIIALGFILAASASTLFAQPYRLDEYGNGISIDGFTIPTTTAPLPFQVATDPTGGITTSPVLIYSLGFQVTPGDLALMNPDGTIADLLRFFTAPGNNSSDVIFYAQPDGSPAGVGIPNSADPVEISKTGVDTQWIPGTTQPPLPGEEGTAPVSAFFKYDFITATPEPSSAVLLVVAAGVWLTARVSLLKSRLSAA